MAGKGKWSLQKKFKRCTGSRQCGACALQPENPPHGPYYELRRRHPETGNQEFVYLGIEPLSDYQLDVVNRMFTGPDAPERAEVLKVTVPVEDAAL
jgi:hypothetical protein